MIFLSYCPALCVLKDGLRTFAVADLSFNKHIAVFQSLLGFFFYHVWNITEINGQTSREFMLLSPVKLTAVIAFCLVCLRKLWSQQYYMLNSSIVFRAAQNLRYVIMLLNNAVTIWLVLNKQILKFTVWVCFCFRFVLLTDSTQGTAFSVCVTDTLTSSS